MRPLTTLVPVLAVLLAIAPAVASDDTAYEPPEDASSVEFTTGFQGSSTDDELARVAEYEAVEANPIVGLSFATSPFDENLVSFELVRGAASDFRGAARLDLARSVRIDASAIGLLHRLDHDTVANLQAVSDIKVVRSEDLDPGADYAIDYSAFEATARFQHPDVPWFSYRLGVLRQHREGTRQVLSTGHCTSCHTTAQGQEIDRDTTDFTFGAHVSQGRIDLDYEVTGRQFRDTGGTPTSFYELAYRPAGPGATPEDLVQPFNDRIWFQNGDFAVDRQPDSDRQTHKLKLRAGLERSAVNVTVVQSNYENATTGLELDFLGYRGRYSWRPTDRMRVEFFAKRDEIDNDDPFIDLPLLFGLMSPPISDGGPGYTGITYEQWINTVARPTEPARNFTSFTRRSAYDRTDDRIGTDLLWRALPRATLRAGYEYRLVDRDNAVLADGTGETTSHTVTFNWNQRVQKRLRWNNRLRFRSTDNPYVARDGGLRAYDPTRPGITTSPKSPLSLQYYELHELRVADLSNYPTDELRARSQLNWSPRANLALSGNVRYRSAENDELDWTTWDRDEVGVGASLWYADGPRFQFTLSLDHGMDEVEAALIVPVMDG